MHSLPIGPATGAVNVEAMAQGKADGTLYDAGHNKNITNISTHSFHLCIYDTHNSYRFCCFEFRA